MPMHIPQYGVNSELDNLFPLDKTKVHYTNSDGSQSDTIHNRYTAATRSCYDFKFKRFTNNPIGTDGGTQRPHQQYDPFNELPPK